MLAVPAHTMGCSSRRLRALSSHLLQGRPAAAAEPVAVDTPPGWPSNLPKPAYTMVPRFSIDTVRGQGEALAHLNQESYVVIKDVLTPSQCAETLEMIWSELEGGKDVTPEHGGGVDRSDPATWQWRHNYPKGGEGGRYGHSEFLWHVRGMPKVKRVWELVCGTDELLVSFDGSCLYRPWGLNEEWNAVHTLGLHVDRVGREGIPDGYVQGFVNLVATSAASGGNVREPSAPPPSQRPCLRCTAESASALLRR